MSDMDLRRIKRAEIKRARKALLRLLLSTL